MTGDSTVALARLDGQAATDAAEAIAFDMARPRQQSGREKQTHQSHSKDHRRHNQPLRQTLRRHRKHQLLHHHQPHLF